MNVVKRMTALTMAALLLMFSFAYALADGTYQMGGFAVEGTDNVYMSLENDGGGYSLYRVASTGGDMHLLETGTYIGDLVMESNVLYYIRQESGSTYQIIRLDGSGGVVLVEFPVGQGETIERLSWYNGVLYLLVNSKLTIVDPETGEFETLSETAMDDYAITGDVIYYISSADRVEYQRTTSTGQDLTASAGTLYSMSITGTNEEKLLDIGITDLKAQGTYLYFRNLADSYLMGSEENTWIVGSLYWYDIAGNRATTMGLNYDWDFYATPGGVIVYRSQDISVFPLTGGEPVVLMSPEAYTMLFAIGDNVYVYEQTNKTLTRVPVNGAYAVQLVGGAPIVDDSGSIIDDNDPFVTLDSNTADDEWLTDDGGDSTSDSTTPTATKKPSATKTPSKGTDSSYIFKNSSKKKLTRSQILDIDKSKWAYARNEIYARHGYVFKTKAYADYFAKKSWYSPGGFSTGDLNSIEWYNMDLLKAMEEEYGVGSGSGSSGSGSSGSGSTGTDGSYLLSNSNKKKLTEADIREALPDSSMWPYARNEIYARHGYKFKTKKYANYFAKKSWYKVGGFSESKLSDTEWHNMELLKKMEKNG